jgi:hypothetical protein
VECLSDADCDDGVFCNGAETCAGTLACLPGSDPCPGALCNESSDMCTQCLADGDCDDGLFCNGAERCDVGLGACAPGSDPCPIPGLEECDEATDLCVECRLDPDCDDGLACNGFERCDPLGRFCVSGTPVDCSGGGDACNDQACAEPGGICENVPKPFATPCNDGSDCTAADRCVSGVCTGISPPYDDDCDGYATFIEERAGCDANDSRVIPTQPTYYAGSRRLCAGFRPCRFPFVVINPATTAREALITWFSPRQRDVWIDSDPACDTTGSCGANGFCARGRVADPCTSDADCALPASTCRLVLNYANASELVYLAGRLRLQDVRPMFPIAPACALKVDMTLPEFSTKAPLRLKVAASRGKDKELIRFRK